MKDECYQIKITESEYGFMYKTKNEYNQTLQLDFSFIKRDSNHMEWWVSFCIVTKRKNTSDAFGNKLITGKDGIKSLIWGKNCIIDFIDFIPKKEKTEHHIYIEGIESRRRNIYKKKLFSLGFNTVLGQQCLCKKIALE